MQFCFSSHYKLECLFKPIHWFQFADDAAVVTINERENQLLLIVLPNGVLGQT